MTKVGDNSRIIRKDFGIVAIGVRGENIHPECREDHEIELTCMFYREAPQERCDRCNCYLDRVPWDTQLRADTTVSITD